MTDDLDFLHDENEDFLRAAQDSEAPAPVSRVNTIEQKKGPLVSAFEWIQLLLPPMLVVVLLLTFVLRLIRVDGSSMKDTLFDGEQVFTTNLLYEPADGDVVVISHGQEYPTPIIKRVIATEGQSVKIDYENNRVLVDGVVIDEPYLPEPMVYNQLDSDLEIPDVIPEGKVFVMGDNRNHSLDSRSQKVGLINKTDIIGKAQLIWLPFNRFGFVD
ncbi:MULTISPECIES: signal peptidase I [unclassified Ruminococcus]|uniref:signal peptidase I n=1 Tax=unclassified Ruminococcus TaxID=2608920 RepID=UPI00210AC920|nr:MULTISPECIES: signal peptidase I [unclassified Ruminococcus]MCQ4023132.1 signal peptidase I [Ruminococcus sp. zg-924]MCQ4115097.1 signal peptidase I [Ruminococcus sp. zg-921]